MRGGWLISYLVLWFLVLAQLFVILLLVRAARQGQGQTEQPESDVAPATGPMVGQAVPMVDLVNLRSEERISLQAFVGKPILITFIDAVCASCHRLAPRLERLYLANQADFHLLLVCRSGPEATKAFMASTNLSRAPIFVDPDGEVALAFNVNVSPFVIFLDEQGMVRDKLTGAQIGETDDRIHVALNRIKRAA